MCNSNTPAAIDSDLVFSEKAIFAARPRGYKTFLCSAQLSTKFQLLIKTYKPTNEDVVFIMLMNVKMPTIAGILTFTSRINFVLSSVEHEKSFIISRPKQSVGPTSARQRNAI